MHWFDNEWAILPTGDVYVLPIDPVIFNYIKLTKIIPVELDLKHVSHKSLVDKNSIRYLSANTTYPMIVTEMQNPHNLPYRMIDGQHRIHKLKESQCTTGMFYIIPESIVLLNLRRVVR